MVRAWGLEPQRIAAREPKGAVTSVTGFLFPASSLILICGQFLDPLRLIQHMELILRDPPQGFKPLDLRHSALDELGIVGLQIGEHSIHIVLKRDKMIAAKSLL